MAKLSQILRTNTAIKWQVISSDKTCLAGDGLIITQNVTITLPIQPAIGDSLQFILLNNSSVVISRNTNLINSAPNNITVNKPSLIHNLVYTGFVNGWFYTSGDTEGIPELAQNIAGEPGPFKYYGTNTMSEKGFWPVPDINKMRIPLSSVKDIDAIVTAAITV